MFLPQRPIAAPGNSLLEQLIYPSPLPEDSTSLDLDHLVGLLQQVGLSDLLQRVQGNWHMSQNWQGTSLYQQSRSAAISTCFCHEASW